MPLTEEIITGREPEYRELPFKKLDARVIRLWRITDLIGNTILLLLALSVILYWGLTHPVFLWWLLGGWIAIAAFSAWYSYWRPARAYANWGYRIDDRILETRSGILFHRTCLLPLSRLQHVDLERGPFERMFGLSSLILHTAGTHFAKLTVPGLDAADAVTLRDRLVEIGGDDAV